MYVSPAARPAYQRTYERALARALRQITVAIPLGSLSIQWDVCQEVLIYEGYFADRPADYKREIIAELARLGESVPESAEMGYHLCYGSPADEHLVMPRDTGLMVEIASDLRRALRRPMNFLHLPVPRDRTDDAYFLPIQDLGDTGDTALYLGLIHWNDRDGDQARMQAARRFVKVFGVASECGWGRTDPARLPGLLESHRLAAQTMQGSA
jgi:hypothetical protein